MQYYTQSHSIRLKITRFGWRADIFHWKVLSCNLISYWCAKSSVPLVLSYCWALRPMDRTRAEQKTEMDSKKRWPNVTEMNKMQFIVRLVWLLKIDVQTHVVLIGRVSTSRTIFHFNRSSVVRFNPIKKKSNCLIQCL